MPKRVTKKVVVNNTPIHATLSETVKAKMTTILSNYPLSVVKGIGAVALFLSLGFNIVSTVAIYGMYRYSNAQWLATVKQWLVSMYNFTIGLFTKVKASQFFQTVQQTMTNFTIEFFTKKPTESQSSYNLRLAIGGVVGIILAAEIVLNGVSTLLLLGTRAIQFAAVATGCSAVYEDIKYAIANPKNVLEKIGNGIKNGFKYCVDGISDLWTSAENKAKPLTNNAPAIATISNNEPTDLLGQASKWYVGIVASATPLLLASQGGAEIIALTGGNMLGATALIASSLMVSVGGLFAVGFGGKYVFDQLTGNNEPVLEQPVQVASPATRKAKALTHEKAQDVAKATAKVIAPSFEKHKEKDAKKRQAQPKAAKETKKAQAERTKAAAKTKPRRSSK